MSLTVYSTQRSSFETAASPAKRGYLTLKSAFSLVFFQTTAHLHHGGMSPNPSASLGNYSELLDIHCPQNITAGDAEASGWMMSPLSCRGWGQSPHLDRCPRVVKNWIRARIVMMILILRRHHWSRSAILFESLVRIRCMLRGTFDKYLCLD